MRSSHTALSLSKKKKLKYTHSLHFSCCKIFNLKNWLSLWDPLTLHFLFHNIWITLKTIVFCAWTKMNYSIQLIMWYIITISISKYLEYWSALKIFIFHACTKFNHRIQLSLWDPLIQHSLFQKIWSTLKTFLFHACRKFNLRIWLSMSDTLKLYHLF